MAEKVINGRTFKVTPMLATQALVLQARVVKIAGPAFSKLGPIMQGYGEGKTEAEKETSNAAAIAAIVDVFTNGDPIAIAELIKDIVAVAQIRRPSGNYDHCDIDGDFQDDKQADIFPVVGFVLQEQFSSFFGGLRVSGFQSTRKKD